MLAVEQAHSLVKEGLRGRSDAAAQAVAILTAGTQDTQPEILADLRRDPPDYRDADLRLTAVAATLDRPGDVADPAAAKSRLHDILFQSRYDGLRAGQSPWDRLWNWVLVQLFNFLTTLHLGAIPAWFWVSALVGLVLVVALVALLVVRTGWTRARRTFTDTGTTAALASRNRFDEADAAAVRGDYQAALRLLVAAVATELSGQPYWESSPLTVRELFRSSGRIDQLRPLLTDFELAVYGHRRVGEDAYLRANRLAEPYRRRDKPEGKAA